MKKHLILACAALLMAPSFLFAQEIIVDQVVAVVGGNAIDRSDIESQYLQARAQGVRDNGTMHCRIFEDMLKQKLLLHQSRLDSIQVSDAQVEQQLNQRLDYFIRQIGSKEKLEEYFKKSIFEIKDDFRDMIREQVATQKMQGAITEGVNITPSEVNSYLKNLTRDSIPQIDTQVEIAQILIYPKYSDEAIFAVKEKLLGLRKRIIDGEKFSTLAILYSEDPGSSAKGGEIGFLSKGELDPEYAKAALSLKIGATSSIIESSFGYHIIQLIDRQEDRVNTRHILVKPKVNREAMAWANSRIDSLVHVIKTDSLSFDKAALYFSGDKDTRMNGGLVINQANASSKFKLDEFQQTDYLMIKDLKPGELSSAYETLDDKGKPVYKVIKLISKSAPHRANLVEDYQFLTEKALEEKKKKVVEDWYVEKRKKTFSQINSDFKDCSFYTQWVK